MCGIAGALYADGRKADSGVLAAMATTLAHRGPDGQGVKSFAGCGLAHRRLSVIDLSEAASQPLGLPDGSAWMVFNGEIYNFRELRQELAAKGHRFRSSGDTEVALAAYREWGETFVERLDGMFALGLWDEGKKRLLLARDRTGKKPLYLYRDGEKLLFASEIKALLAHPGVDDALDDTAVPLYLALGYVPTPRTHFRRIVSLPAGSRLTLRRDLQGEERRFWSFPVAREPVETDPQVAAEKVRSLFRAAVERRLVSDVPLGAFLSGGIDSTLVVGVMSELGSAPVKTFSIGFRDAPRHDETAFARLVARRFQTDHHELTVDARQWELLEKMAWHFDQPFGDSSAIPTYLVARMTREHVTVALSGDGGDELFAGYPRFRKAARMERLPRGLSAALASAAHLLPAGRHGGPVAKLQRSLDRAAASPAGRVRGWTGFFREEELAEALSPDLAGVDLDGSYQEALSEAAGADPTNRLLHLNARTYLLDDLNVKMDRASMAASLETRAPFLDTALMEYVFRLPGWMKQRRGTSKWILKRAFGDLLPGEIARRPKKGFVVPLGDWFRGPLRPWLEERLLGPSSFLYPLLRRPFVERMAAEHRSGRRDWGQHFWLLGMLEVFREARASRVTARAASR